MVRYLGQFAVIGPKIGHGIEVFHEVDDDVLVFGNAGIESFARNEFEPDAIVMLGIERPYMYRNRYRVLIKTFSENLVSGKGVMYSVFGVLTFSLIGLHMVGAVVLVIDGSR